MHRELEKLRQQLKPSIFVGDPGQETFAHKADRIGDLRRKAERKKEKRPSKDTKQVSLADY